MGEPGQMRARWRGLSGLDKVRLVALVYSLVGLIFIAPQVFIAPRSAPVLGSVGFVFLGTTLVVSFALRRLFPGEPVVSPVVMFLAGISLAEPYGSIALALCTVAAQSLYGSLTSAVVRLVATCIAMPLVVAVSPSADSRHASWHSAILLGNIPGVILTAVLMRVLLTVLQRQIQVTGRVSLLIEAGTRLLNLTDVTEVRAVTSATATGLCQYAPGTGALLIRLGDDALVIGSAGLAGMPMGTRLPAAPLRALTGNGATTNDIAALDPLVGRRRWRVANLNMAEERWLLLVGARRRVPDDVMDSFQLLANQRSEAEFMCRTHAELTYQARHDSLTGLVSRGEFLARLAEAMRGSGPGDVAIIIVDLDDFKLINDTNGHLVGDRVLQAIADRLRDIVGRLLGPAGVAARLGGDEFAVLVAARAHVLATEMAQETHRVLHRPIKLDDVTILPRASIGLSVSSESGLTAIELLRQADLAMYQAKEKGRGQGKTNAVRYVPDERGDGPDPREPERRLARGRPGR
jgi:diguanylate cyclase (GGDEF)-like protein